MIVLLSMYASPVMAETAFERSESLIAAGQITEARRALRAELRLRPDHIEARYNLALLLQDIDHSADAMVLYKQNLAMAWHLPSLVNLVNILQQQGKAIEARRWLLKATKKFRNEAVPWYLLAKMDEQNGDVSAAKRHLQRAIKADPLNGFAWLYLAEFQSRQQHGDQALKSAAKAMRLLPACAACWQIYGGLLERQKAHQQALLAYQRSLAIQPSDKTRRQLIATLHSLGEHQRADMMQRSLGKR